LLVDVCWYSAKVFAPLVCEKLSLIWQMQILKKKTPPFVKIHFKKRKTIPNKVDNFKKRSGFSPSPRLAPMPPLCVKRCTNEARKMWVNRHTHTKLAFKIPQRTVFTRSSCQTLYSKLVESHIWQMGEVAVR